jgi:hypothetical protein
MNINFKINKLYYKYINTSVINHYRLLLLTEEYRNIGINYYKKYPTAQEFINLNKDLFDSNKNAEKDYIDGSIKQTNIKNDFYVKQEILCEDTKNKDCKVCSDSFKQKYLNQKYHFEQSIENIISDIQDDIHNMDNSKK